MISKRSTDDKVMQVKNQNVGFTGAEVIDASIFVVQWIWSLEIQCYNDVMCWSERMLFSDQKQIKEAAVKDEKRQNTNIQLMYRAIDLEKII